MVAVVGFRVMAQGMTSMLFGFKRCSGSEIILRSRSPGLLSHNSLPCGTGRSRGIPSQPNRLRTAYQN